MAFLSLSICVFEPFTAAESPELVWMIFCDMHVSDFSDDFYNQTAQVIRSSASRLSYFFEYEVSELS